VLILPSPPYFILDFLFLFGCLLDGGDDASLPSVDFDHLVLLHLLDYHLSPSLLPLVLLLFVLAIRQSTLLSCLGNRPFSLWLSLSGGLLRGLILIRRWLFALSTLQVPSLKFCDIVLDSLQRTGFRVDLILYPLFLLPLLELIILGDLYLPDGHVIAPLLPALSLPLLAELLRLINAIPLVLVKLLLLE
jgi:hypothetical protein